MCRKIFKLFAQSGAEFQFIHDFVAQMETIVIFHVQSVHAFIWTPASKKYCSRILFWPVFGEMNYNETFFDCNFFSQIIE